MIDIIENEEEEEEERRMQQQQQKKKKRMKWGMVIGIGLILFMSMALILFHIMALKTTMKSIQEIIEKIVGKQYTIHMKHTEENQEHQIKGIGGREGGEEKRERETTTMIKTYFDHQPIIIHANRKGEEGRELIEKRVWKPKETILYMRMVENIDRVIEVGSTQGWGLLLGARNVKKTVTAYPKEESYCRNLKKTIEENELKGAAITLECDKAFEKLPPCNKGETCAARIKKENMAAYEMTKIIGEIANSYCFGQIDIKDKETEKVMKQLTRTTAIQTSLFSIQQQKIIPYQNVREGETIIVLAKKSACAATLQRTLPELTAHLFQK